MWKPEEYHLVMDVLYDYVNFLYRQRKYSEGIAVGERLYAYYAKNAGVPEGKRAQLMNLLGLYYQYNRNYDKAEQMLRKALEICRRLTEKYPSVYEADVAGSCNNLAALLKAKGEYSKAEELYREALALYKRWSEKEAEVKKLKIS